MPAKRSVSRRHEPTMMPVAPKTDHSSERSETRRLLSGMAFPEFNAGVDLQVAVRDGLDRPVMMEQALRLMAGWVKRYGLTASQKLAFTTALDLDDRTSAEQRVERRAEEIRGIKRHGKAGSDCSDADRIGSDHPAGRGTSSS